MIGGQLLAAVDLEDEEVGEGHVEEEEEEPEGEVVGEVAKDLQVEEDAEEEAGARGGGCDAQVPKLVHLRPGGSGLPRIL